MLKQNYFGVVHLSDRTMLFWDCIVFFAARAFFEQKGIDHRAFHVASPGCQADPERCARLRAAWADHNATVSLAKAA